MIISLKSLNSEKFLNLGHHIALLREITTKIKVEWKFCLYISVILVPLVEKMYAQPYGFSSLPHELLQKYGEKSLVLQYIPFQYEILL